MAKGGGGILEYILLGGAAYLGYLWLTSPSPAAVAAAPAGGAAPPTPAAPAAPSVAYVPPTPTQALQTAAGANVTSLDADQWQYYWNQLGNPPITGTDFNNLFFPQGRPSDPSLNPMMTAAQFVAALGTKGLAGYKGLGMVNIPIMIAPAPGGRGFAGGRYSLGDLMRAGRGQ